MEDIQFAANFLNKADYIIFLIGPELDTFIHLDYLNYGEFDFWRDYPEFKEELAIPDEVLTPEYMKNNPKHFWGFINYL